MNSAWLSPVAEMQRIQPNFPRRSASDIRLRTSLVTWLGIGLSLVCLVLAYSFYMRYEADTGEMRVAGEQDALASIIRGKGLACSRVCAVDRHEDGERSVVTCGTEAPPRSCARTQKYAVSILVSPQLN